MDREARIQAALRGLESGQYKSVHAAAKAEDVPYTTLIYRRKGGQARHNAHSHQQACTQAEEEVLVKWIQRWHSQGFPIRHGMLHNTARFLILDCLDRQDTISAVLTNVNWPARFLG